MTTEHFLLVLRMLRPGIPESESAQPRAWGELRAPFLAVALLRSVEETGALLQQPNFFHLIFSGDHESNRWLLVPSERKHWYMLSRSRCDFGGTLVRQAPSCSESASPRDAPGLGPGRRWLVFTPVLGWGLLPSAGWSSVRAPCGEGLSGRSRRWVAPKTALHMARAWAGLCAAAGGQLAEVRHHRPGPRRRAAASSRLLRARGWGCPRTPPGCAVPHSRAGPVPPGEPAGPEEREAPPRSQAEASSALV